MNLFDFQAEAVEKLSPRRSRLIGDDPGLGKTYMGIALDLANREDHRDKTLIICPASVISVWDEHCMDLTDLDVYIIDRKNRKPFQQAALDPSAGGYFIMHWEALRLMPALQKVAWHHIIADEAHRAKGRKTQQTVSLKKLRTVYKTALTGTPADNKPQDLWSLLNWLWPRYYTSYWKFVNRYCTQEVTPEGYRKFIGVQNEGILHKEMEPWYVRRRKSEVLTDLPGKYYTRIWVDLDPKQRKAYDQMRKTMIAWVADNEDRIQDPIIANAVVAQLIRLQQFADGFMKPIIDPATGEQAIKLRWKDGATIEVPQWEMVDPSSKLDALMEIIQDREPEQLVVFSQYKSVINLLARRLDAKEIPFGLLTGDVPQEDRHRNIQSFQAGRTRVFAGTIAAGGVGITLTASSTVAFVDRAWSPSQNTQAEDRAHRIGQKNAVEIIDIMARNTVDLGKHQQLKMKAELIRRLLGDKVEPDMIIKELEEE